MSPHLLMMWLQQFSAEGLTLALFLCCGILILFMMRVFGAIGLMVYSSLAVVVANIQVQKASTFEFFS
ncbi:hypothetical protein QPK87_14490 [Kamptonema cortianum]|nr:hypothetical protein [Kamptonema cortianum]